MAEPHIVIWRNELGCVENTKVRDEDLAAWVKRLYNPRFSDVMMEGMRMPHIIEIDALEPEEVLKGRVEKEAF